MTPLTFWPYLLTDRKAKIELKVARESDIFMIFLIIDFPSSYIAFVV